MSDTTLVYLSRGHEHGDEGGATVVYRPRRMYLVDNATAASWKGRGLTMPLPSMPEVTEPTEADITAMAKAETMEELVERAARMTPPLYPSQVTGTGRDGGLTKADMARAIAAREADAIRAAARRTQVPEVRMYGPARSLPAFPAAPHMGFENDGAVSLYIRNAGTEPLAVTLRRSQGEPWTGEVPAGGYTVFPALSPGDWNAYGRGVDCGVDFSRTEGVSVAALRLSPV
jgi:hypothetical protein